MQGLHRDYCGPLTQCESLTQSGVISSRCSTAQRGGIWRLVAENVGTAMELCLLEKPTCYIKEGDGRNADHPAHPCLHNLCLCFFGLRHTTTGIGQKLTSVLAFRVNSAKWPLYRVHLTLFVVVTFVTYTRCSDRCQMSPHRLLGAKNAV